jgi:hypothetical protein
MSKTAKQRFCPAVRRQISSAECGENRGSRYACPSDCLFSPLACANYELLLELESEVDRKSEERLIAEERDSPALRKTSQLASAANSPHAWHAFCEHAFFFLRDAAGLSLMERWQRQGFPGLKNDERVLLQAKMRTRVALLEIHRIIDTEQIEAVDLLEAAPRPMILRDRSLASRAPRFATALCWVYPLPHYWRLSGTAIILPEIAQFEPDEIVRETAVHLGGPSGEMELRLWLVENFVRVDESLMATSRMRRMQMLAGVDAQYGKAVYEMRAPFGACRDALDEIPGVEPDSLSQTERNEGFADARVWETDQDPGKVTAAPFTLGRVLLGQSHCRLESMGRERLGQLRGRFETALGERARFVSERFDDLAAKLSEKEPRPNEAIIPPRLLEEPTKIIIGASRAPIPPGGSPADAEAQQRDRYLHAFLEDPVPALGGLTPRAAAQDPALRPKLIRLLKQWVRRHDEDNLRTGRNDDINWLLRELGATEIIFDPSPPRLRLAEDDEADEDDFDDSDDDSAWPLPVLPPEPFSLEEVLARQAAILREFEVAKRALDYLEDCGSFFIDDAQDLCEEGLEPGEFGLLVPFLIQARFALVPSGFREPVLDFERLAEAYHQTLETYLQKVTDIDSDLIIRWFEDGRQPVLAQILAFSMSQAFQSLPEKEKPALDSEVAMMFVLRLMIDELDRSIRE